MTYRAVVLPGVERIPVTTLRMLEDFAGSGGVLIATRRAPGRAPGFRATPDDHASVRAASARLFQASGAPGRLVTDEREELQRALSEGVHAPTSRFTPAAPEVGFVHRRLPYADVYFVANTSNVTVQTAATFAVQGTHAEVWDPMTGTCPAGRVVGRSEPAVSCRGSSSSHTGRACCVFTNRSPSRGGSQLPPEGGSHGAPPPIP